MSKIERLEELLVTYRLRKEVMSEAEERLMDWHERVNNAADELAETVTDLQELGFDVAAFEDTEDLINDLTPHEGEQEDELPEWAKLKADDGDWQPYDYSGQAPDNVVSVLYADGEVDSAAGAVWLIYEDVVSDTFPKEDVIIGYRTSTDEKHLEAQPETQAEPAPAPEGFIPWDGGPDPFREMSDADLLAVQKAWTEDETCGTWYGYCEVNPRSLILADEAQWTHTCDDDLYHITALKLPSGYELVDAEGGKVVRKIDHAAEPALAPETDLTTWNEIPGVGYVAGCGVANLETPTDHPAEVTAQIENQAESESTETEAGVETVTEEPEASADEEPVENEPRFLATHSSVSDKPKLKIDDIENTVTRGGEATDDPFQADRQAFNAET